MSLSQLQRLQCRVTILEQDLADYVANSPTATECTILAKQEEINRLRLLLDTFALRESFNARVEATFEYLDGIEQPFQRCFHCGVYADECRCDGGTGSNH